MKKLILMLGLFSMAASAAPVRTVTEMKVTQNLPSGPVYFYPKTVDETKALTARLAEECKCTVYARISWNDRPASSSSSKAASSKVAVSSSAAAGGTSSSSSTSSSPSVGDAVLSLGRPLAFADGTPVQTGDVQGYRITFGNQEIYAYNINEDVLVTMPELDYREDVFVQAIGKSFDSRSPTAKVEWTF